MTLLDLFCGAGGAGMGYHRAGFEVVGVDIKPQKHYPFEFHCADAFAFLEQHGREFDVIHASPPCQAYSVATRDKSKHHDLVPETQARLRGIGKPYIIENVPGAPLDSPFILCGSMFGLSIPRGQLRRHRLFESNMAILQPECLHDGRLTVGVYGHGGDSTRSRKLYRDEAAIIMQIDWMSRDEMSQAIPPAYTEWIGKQLLRTLKEQS